MTSVPCVMELLDECRIGRLEMREACLEAAISQLRAKPGKALRRRLLAVVRVLTSDPDSGIRMHATEIIGEFGNRVDLVEIHDRLKDRSWEVRAAAVSSLARIGGAREKRVIALSLSDKNAIVRRYAAVALYDALGRHAESELREAKQKEKDDLALVGIAGALSLLGDSDSLELLKRYAESPHRRISSPAKEMLAESASHPKVRRMKE